MKYVLTLLTFASTLISYAQNPDYLPSEGLIAWYPFEGNATDLSGNGYDAELMYDAILTEDRFGLPNRAIFLDGHQDHVLTPAIFNSASDRTISIWLELADVNDVTNTIWNTVPHWIEAVGWNTYFLNEPGMSYCLGDGDNWTSCGENTTFFDVSVDMSGWKHLASVKEGLEWRFYIDGQLIHDSTLTFNPLDQHIPLMFGAISVGGEEFTGAIDDIGIWDRALTAPEIFALSHTDTPVIGCTDASACNYNFDADFDDGRCIYPPIIDLGEDVQTCEDSVVLDAGEGFNFYEWSTGETTQTIVVTETGEYAVSASNVIENNHALQFNGTDATGAPAEPILFGMESFSVSVDCKLNAFKGNDSEPYSYIIGHPLTQGTGDHGFKIQTAGTSLNGGFQVHINDEGTTHFNVISFDNSSGTNVELDQWYDLTMVVDRDNAQFSFYVDGILIETQTIHPDFGNVDHPNGMSLGVQSINGSSLLNGDLDNLQIWDVALSDEEVAHWQNTVPSGSETGLVGYWNFEEGEGDEANDLSQVAPTIALTNVGWTDNTPIDVFDASCAASDTIQVSWLIRGCTDPEACNYVEDASCDDGTCASCEALQTACGPGTIWDAEMQMCIGDGSGDINLDGCVQLNDLLDLLSVYGNCAAEESAWQCGDPLEYQGYDYTTVQIGEQCWFAENLRAENYANGDALLNELDDHTWSYTQEGATTIYGEDEGCQEVFPIYDACDPDVSLTFFGRLYNWFAVNDSRKLCPSGWSIPSNDAVDDLLLQFPDAPGLKSIEGWTDEGNGTNASGYDGWPGGVRYQQNTNPDGEYGSAGSDGHWWTSTEVNGSKAFDWYMSHNTCVIGRQAYPKNFGFSVRCIKDAE